MVDPGTSIDVAIADSDCEVIAGAIELFFPWLEFDEVHSHTRICSRALARQTGGGPGHRRCRDSDEPNPCLHRSAAGTHMWFCRGRGDQDVGRKALRHPTPAGCPAPPLQLDRVAAGGRALFPVRFSTLDGVMQDISFLRTID